jgi:hypothetical protein
MGGRRRKGSMRGSEMNGVRVQQAGLFEGAKGSG